MNILSIRQIDHPFIPLSFHWSGRYLNPHLQQYGFISDFNFSDFFRRIKLFWNGNCVISSPSDKKIAVHRIPGLR
jgi:hypothetical protein